MPSKPKNNRNVIKYSSKKRPSSGNGKKQKKKGIIPNIQFRLRKGYVAYRRKKAELQKSRDFSELFTKRNMIIGGSGICALIVLLIIVWGFTNKNSYEVFVGDKSIGFIAMNKALTENGLHDTAVSKLAAELGSNVQVNEMVTLKPVHASKSKQSAIDYVVGEVYKSFTYKVEACAISVNNSVITILKSQSEADEILGNIIKAYVPEGAVFIDSDSGFVEKVETTRKYVDSSEIESKELAISKLSAQSSIEQTYTAKSGDNIWTIAAKNNMSTDDLLRLNPEITDPAKLRVGQSLTITRPLPLLSVKVVLEEKVTEIDLKKEQRVDNPERPTSYSKIIQEGKDGQKEVTYHITIVNGAEVERVAVFERNIVPTEPYIIEVGSKG